MALKTLKMPGAFLKVGIDRVWLLSVLIAFGIVVSLNPIRPYDFWWHLKIGQMIYTNHIIPSTNMFAWSVPADQPFIYGEWLSELFFYVIYRLGSIPLIIITHTILSVATFALVGVETIRRTGSWRIAGIAAALAAGMAANNQEYRPQMMAGVLFMSVLILLGAYVDRKIKRGWLFLAPLLVALWANLHGTFLLGIILFGVFFVGESVRTYLKLEDHLTWKETCLIGFVGILCGLAITLNPRFLGIYSYAYTIITSPSVRSLTLEWLPIAPDTYYTIIFYVTILLFLFVLAYSRYRPTPTEFLLLIAFMWLAWTGLRHVLWYSLVAMPILGKAIYQWVGDKPWIAKIPEKNFAGTLFLLVLVIPFILVQPFFIDKLPLPESYWQKVTLHNSSVGPLIATSNPVKAVDYLRDHPGGKLYNDMGFGSYMTWALPDQKVFIDTRIELYPYQQWMDYININKGTAYNQLLDKYGANRLFLEVKEQSGLIQYLEKDPSWRKEYADPYAQIWVKNRLN